MTILLQLYFTNSLKRTQNCLIFCEFVTCQMTAPDPREVRDLHSRYRLSLKNSLSDHFTSRLFICGILYHQRYEIVAHYIYLKNALMHASIHFMVNVPLFYRIAFEIAPSGTCISVVITCCVYYERNHFKFCCE